MPILTDGVVTLRTPVREDAEAIYEACQDPEIPRWTNVPSPYGREDAYSYVEAVATQPGVRAFLAFTDGVLVGSFSVMELDLEARYGEIGYWVAAPARGRGLATRALTLLRDWAAAELGLELIHLLIHEDNERSRRLAERTGFLDTGERRPAPRTRNPTPPTPPSHAVYAWRPA
jgi:RimJ/RimL family protein N-acetyltransferase